jgi:hypothetical protein
MRTHRVASVALTAVVGLGTLVGTASQAFAAPSPSNGSVIVQSGHQGPTLGPKDYTQPTTPTTVKPNGPGDIAVPPHVDPPLPGPGDVIVNPDPGCTGPHCGPGDIAQPDPGCTGPLCGPGDIGQPTDPCKVPRTNDAGDPCEPDPCKVPRTNAAGDPCHHHDPCEQTPMTVGVRDAQSGTDCGGTTGGTDGGTTGGSTTGGSTTGGRLPHTGMNLAEELAAGVALTGFGALLTRAARRRRASEA